MAKNTPLKDLITQRCRDLGLSRSELIVSCDYKNIAKGLRRLDAACSGDLDQADALLCRLPKALQLPAERVQHAAAETVRLIAAKEDALWRASFEPAAFLLGTRNRPSQICMYGISGGAERWLKITFDLDEPPISYAQQALAVVRRRPFIPFFGATTGFFVNYTPDRAVRFDLEGLPVETLARAYHPGEVTLYLRGREFQLSILD